MFYLVLVHFCAEPWALLLCRKRCGPRRAALAIPINRSATVPGAAAAAACAAAGANREKSLPSVGTLHHLPFFLAIPPDL